MALTTTPSELTATALTLTTVAQPNITSVGTLTSLNVTAADGVSDNSYVATIRNQEATDGRSFGLNLQAGSNTTDIPLNISTHDAGTLLFRIKGDGTALMGAAGNLVISTNSVSTTSGHINLAPAGNVGIADTTPAEKLSVTGAILSEGDHGTAVNAMGASVGVLMHATGDTAYITATSNGNSHRYLSLRALNTGAANPHQVFLSYTGNVGIGTNAPGNTFVVKGAASTSPILEMINSDTEDNDTGRESTIRFSGFRSGGEAMINAQITGTHLDSGDDDKGGLTFFSNNGSGIAERMRLNQWGRVGIGTDNPIAALSVKATSASNNSHILHVQRPDGLGHASEPFSEILIQNQESTNGYQYGGMTIMADNQAHVRFQVGNSDSWAGTGAKRWQVRVGVGAGTDQLSVYSWTAAQEVLEISSSGTLTAASTSTNYAFHAGNGTGKVGMGALNSSYYHWVRQSGPTSWYFSQATYADGGFHTYSDERLKKDITVISNAVDAVKKMRGVTFNWKVTEDRGREGKQFGCIAQDLLKVDENLPELMIDPLAKAGEEESTDKLYTLDYSRITPYLIEAIKEQQTLIETLQTKVAALEAK